MQLDLIIGLLAATLTTLAFAPQALHTLRTKNTAGISLSMYVMFVCGVSVWIVYGMMVGDTAILLANIFTFLLALPVLIMILLNRRQK